MLRPHSWTNDFDCQLTPSVCPHAPGDSTDMPDSLSAVEIQDRRHDWLDKNVPTHSSPATGTRQASVPGVKVTPNERGYSPDVDSGKDSGRQHRHRSRSRSRTSRTTASGVGSEALSANSNRRRRSEGGESANVKRVNDRREVSFGPASSSPPRREQTDEAPPVVRPAPLLIEDKQVALIRVQLAEREVNGVDDAAIAEELEAQGGHVGRTVNRLKNRHENRPVALPAPVHSRRSGSEHTAAEIAANVAQTAAVAGGVQQRRQDEAALRYYTKAFKVESGRHATPSPAPHLGFKGPAPLRRVRLSQVSYRYLWLHRSPSSEEDWRPMTRTRARLDGTGENTAAAGTSVSDESAKKSGWFLQASTMPVGRSFDHEDLLAEPLETLDALEKDMDEKLRQVRSAQNAKHVADRLTELASLSASMRFLPVAKPPSESQSEQGSNSRANPVGDAEATDEVDGAGEPSLHVQTTNAAGAIKSATEVQTLTFRLRLRGALDSSRCEIATLLLILVYGLLVLFHLGVEGLDLDDWNSVYLFVDALFLSIFMIEIILRLYVFGSRYCSNILNVADSFAISFSFAITLLEVAGVNLGGGEESGGQAEDGENEMLKKLAILLRFLRIGRLVTVLMRTMRTLEHMAETSENELDLNGNAVPDDATFSGERATSDALP